MQNITNWPLFVKAGFSLIIGVLVVGGLLEIPKLNVQKGPGDKSSQETAKELIEIDIIIESDTRKVLEDAEIRFVSKGSPEIRKTNTDGYARIAIPVRNDVDINISKKGFETSRHTLNLSNDPNRSKIFYLKVQKP